MDDHQFKQLLAFFNRSWKGYRKVRKSVKKRTARHMQALGCRGIEAYLQLLDTDAAARKACETLLTVSISRFFRDRKLWQTLGEDILPALAAKNPDRLRIWSAGCARGEEAYSLRITWEELKLKGNRLPALAITATDINAAYLAQARAGIYTRGSLRELPAELKTRYFSAGRGGRQWSIRPELQTDIDWTCRDLATWQPPDGSFDLIFLRNNLLTYYRDPEKSTAFKNLTGALSPDGFLIIGSHERLPAWSRQFVPVTGSRHIFRYRP